MSRVTITALLIAAVLPATAGCAAKERTAPAAHARSSATRVASSSAPAGRTASSAGPPPATTGSFAPTQALSSGDPADPRGGPGFSLPMRVVTNTGGTLVFVPVRVDGRGPYEFVLDTGSSNSSVDRSLVSRLDLPRTGQRHRVQGVTGSGTVPIVKIRRWTLGGVPLRASSLAVVDLGMNVSGLLGSDELRHFGSVTLDFAHDKVWFRR